MPRNVQPAFVAIRLHSDDALLSVGSEATFSSIPQPDLRKVHHTLFEQFAGARFQRGNSMIQRNKTDRLTRNTLGVTAYRRRRRALRWMRALAVVSAFWITAGSSFLVTETRAASLQDHVLGLRIGMTREDVHRRLKRMGTLEREERGKQEVWTLAREPQFASVLVGFDADFRVRYVTAIAREGGRRLRYSELAPIQEARAENANGAYTRYTWEIKPDKKSAGYFLIAEGRDPEYLKSFSIKRHN